MLRSILRRLRRSASRTSDAIQRATLSRGRKAVGWITAASLPSKADGFGSLEGSVRMRVANIGWWLNANTDDLWNESYRTNRKYDVVVFSKAMELSCQAEAARLLSKGTRVVFDANVNYYDVWGEYDIVDTRPTETQQRDAIAMTRMANHVVADSSYIADIARRYNSNVTWIPDNVDLTLFRRRPPHKATSPVTLIWSGVSKKADHLLMIREVLGSLGDVNLVAVSNEMPAALGDLEGVIPLRFVRYSDAVYASTLRECDIVISPKRLINSYEMGHTEYKITLGMAVGLPAVASPQPSYVEAISHSGGGLVAETPEQWRVALQRLVSDPGLRADLGERAARTARERYSTAVTAAVYSRVLRGLC